MENTQLLEEKLNDINQGAYWFRVIGTVLTVFGILMVVFGGLKLLPLLGPRAGEYGPVLADAVTTASAAIGYWIMAWLARRAADAFEAISALIRELGEINLSMPIIVRLDVMMALRKIRGLDLAQRVGLTQANLSKLKTGKVKAMRFSTLESLCRELQCQPGDLLEYVSDPEDELK